MTKRQTAHRDLMRLFDPCISLDWIETSERFIGSTPADRSTLLRLTGEYGFDADRYDEMLRIVSEAGYSFLTEIEAYEAQATLSA